VYARLFTGSSKRSLKNSPSFQSVGDVALSPSAHPHLTGLKGFARCTSLSQIFPSALTHYVRGGEKNFP